MTSVIDARSTAVLRRAAVRATLAPSIHNTQPWRFHLRRGTLDLYADHDRQLRVLDPTGRQLTISCGCALFNARVAIAAGGMGADIVRFPDPADPNLLARVSTREIADADAGLLAILDAQVELRQTNRRRFADEEVPTEVLDALEGIAASEGCELLVVRRPEHRLGIAVLSQRADAMEHADPAYRAELRAWTTQDPRRADGVQAMSVAHAGAGSHDDIPLRDFDTHGMGALPVETHSSISQCLVLLGTAGDRPADWLRAGEALERILLEVTRRGYVAGPLTQIVEMPFARAEMRQTLGLTMNPHVLLRVGRSPSTPASRRRRLVDVLVEDA
jgi:nitroreductase